MVHGNTPLCVKTQLQTNRGYISPASTPVHGDLDERSPRRPIASECPFDSSVAARQDHSSEASVSFPGPGEPEVPEVSLRAGRFIRYSMKPRTLSGSRPPLAKMTAT